MHNINYNSQRGSYSFVSARERAWHSLGTVVDGAMTSDEAIKAANLDYEVLKTPSLALVHGEHKVINGRFGTYRNDTGDVLGEVGSAYHIVQNKEAFSFFDHIVGAKDAIFETAGALGKGGKIFITAKLPGHIRIGKEDLMDKYIFLMNSHDGSTGIEAAFSNIRIVCNNTLNIALRTCTNKITFRHTVNVEEKLKQGAELKGLTNQYFTETEEVFNFMAKKPIVDAKLKEIIILSLGNKETIDKSVSGEGLSKRTDNLLEKVYAYAMEAPSQQLETTRGTVFGAYNAITGYFQNVKSFKSAESQFESIYLEKGQAYRAAQKAFDLCLEACK